MASITHITKRHIMCHKTHSLRDGQKLTYSQAVYLAIVNTDFRSFLLLSSFSAYCSSPNSGLPRKLTFYGPSYFDPTTGEVEGICKKIFLLLFQFFMEADFRVFSLLFMTSVWLRQLGPTLVPGVLLMKLTFKKRNL